MHTYIHHSQFNITRLQMASFSFFFFFYLENMHFLMQMRLITHLQRSVWFDLPVKLVVSGGIWRKLMYFIVIVAVAAVTSTFFFFFYCIQHFLWACFQHYLISIIPLVNHEQIHNSIMVQFISWWILTIDTEHNTKHSTCLFSADIQKKINLQS